MSERPNLRPRPSELPVTKSSSRPSAVPLQTQSSLPIRLPHQSRPVAKVHQTIVSTDSYDPNLFPFGLETSNLHLHQRLMRSIQIAPKIALYPWMIDVMKQTRKDRELNRNKRIRCGDERYATSASAFLSWPLDNRRIRLGVFTTRSGVSNQNLSHVWALGVVNSKKRNGGCLVFIFDEAGTAALEKARQEDSLLTPLSILRGQRQIIQKLTAKHYDIRYLFYGGRPFRGLPEMCYESTISFVEHLVDKINKAPDFNTAMLKECGMEEIPRRGMTAS